MCVDSFRDSFHPFGRWERTTRYLLCLYLQAHAIDREALISPELHPTCQNRLLGIVKNSLRVVCFSWCPCLLAVASVELVVWYAELQAGLAKQSFTWLLQIEPTTGILDSRLEVLIITEGGLPMDFCTSLWHVKKERKEGVID